MTKYEDALVRLVAGDIDVETWREVAAAAPSTFYKWANRFEGLRNESILTACWQDPQFRRRLKDRTIIRDNVEKFEKFTLEDFDDIAQMKPFTDHLAADQLRAFAKGSYRFDEVEGLRLLSKYPKKQVKLLLAMRQAKGMTRSEVRLSPEHVVSFIEQAYYKAPIVTWLLSYPPEEIQQWAPKEVLDPVMGYIFGGPKIVAKLNKTPFRKFGYLSLLNVRDPDWAQSFQLWLNRHGRYDKKLVQNFRTVSLTRDLGDLDDEFFTDRRLGTLDGLLRHVPGIRLRVPPILSLKFKELFLCGMDGEYDNIRRCVIDGIKAFDHPQ
jgi:hypothetical protein